ncbi:DUF4124 domain-containing protein [Niveibacterium sp. 24ML]|uniref:DUF4124 domain-containing protein n=1 Tax=Niveibacterium sp. 24ML TaxID=2985512 RepID=UPI00226E4B42|nr:DUF4124 domain-containing protein [Niveibacterium sp. 24ML]MCX9154979.1 DUF4124 domain-containing protein [Niveibacterium sp. 24ML]
MNFRMRLLVLLIPLAFAANAASAADAVFKWRDENGRWQYGNQPPAGVKAEKVTAEVSTIPAYKPKPLPALKEPEPAIAPAKSTAAPPPVTSAQRQKLLEACEKAGGEDCSAVVNAALNASVNQAAKRNTATPDSKASPDVETPPSSNQQ